MISDHAQAGFSFSYRLHMAPVIGKGGGGSMHDW